jgi:hypothetical protein
LAISLSYTTPPATQGARERVRMRRRAHGVFLARVGAWHTHDITSPVSRGRCLEQRTRCCGSLCAPRDSNTCCGSRASLSERARTVQVEDAVLERALPLALGSRHFVELRQYQMSCLRLVVVVLIFTPPTPRARSVYPQCDSSETTTGPSMQLCVFSDTSASEGVRYRRMDQGSLLGIARGISIVR